MTAIATFSVVAIDCREPRKVAEFYSAVLGVPIAREEPDWVQLAEGAPLAFQLAPDHVPPQWPSAEHPQQMHLDLDVTDFLTRLVESGAVDRWEVKDTVQTALDWLKENNERVVQTGHASIPWQRGSAQERNGTSFVK